MEQIKAIFWIYKTCLIRTVELVRNNLGIIFAPIAYGVLLSAAAMLLAPLGMIGGIIMGVVLAACASSGLYIIENVVRMNKTTLQDFTRGFSVYLWDILTIAFIFWIPMRLLAQVAFTTPNGPLLYLGVQILLYVIFNPVPELIYQGRVSGLALLSASYQFIVENWIEWLLPNLVIGAVAYMLRSLVYQLVAPMPFFLQYFLVEAAFGLFLTFLMIFRGLLFAELHGTTRRSRVYRYKARSS
ncbi:MAG TPA: hypothetical protein VLJ79_27005 [Candidatus Binatia bacterium]|nr:hypothetical protein [Candidatus Binatia bacterium]